MGFTDEQIKRYSRHIILPEVGGKGQRKIRESRILVIGAGGLGSPAAYYLAAAGVGTLGIIDGDVVDLSNLQRQIIHHTADLDKPKVISAKEKIEALNPDVRVNAYHGLLTSQNALNLFKDYDIIIDGTDNFPAKFLSNDAAVFTGKPLVHGGILRFVGQIYSIIPHKSACYRCLFNSPPPPGLIPTCQEAGVVGVLAGVIGTIQATEALKLILNIGEPLTDRLMTFDAQKMEFREIRIRRNPCCPVCGDNPTIKELIDYEQEVCSI
ncbi:MAG: molybdopterin-synthase adenylyltransferase MoeB [Nitrospirae bacterium]|nr:molybdopterin-synthase adenylyltransferase MoeB [Nitrospirota bacterium]